MQIFLVFLVAYVLSQFFRAFLAVIAPELAAELSLSPADLGNISAVWFLVFGLSQFGVGYALDRIGPRRTVPATMMCAVLGATLFAAAQGFWSLLVAMALIGMGCSAIYMGALYIFGRTFPPARFGLLASWIIGLGSIGNLLGATPLALATEAIGWRSTFLVIAGITAAAALLVYGVIRDPPRAERPEGGGSRGFLTELGEVLSIRGLWPLMPLTGIAYAVVAAERGLWAGPYMTDVYGLEPVARGNVLLLMAAAMSAGALFYGAIDSALAARRKQIIMFGSLVSATGFASMGLWPGSSIAATTTALVLIGAFGAANTLIMAEARRFVPDHLLGRGITTMNFLVIGGAGFVQPLSGALVGHLKAAGRPPEEVYASLHIAFAVALVIALTIYFLAPDRRQARGLDQPPSG